jgi:DNA-binding response OmpR family regulator
MTGAPARNRILVVDDDDACRYAKYRILRQAGYEVLEAATGNDALCLLGREEPDLVLLDVRLPDINGLEVCRRIKQNPDTKLIPVLQMSASFCDDKSKVAGLEGGADGYITEPVEPVLLVATVRAGAPVAGHLRRHYRRRRAGRHERLCCSFQLGALFPDRPARL